MKTKYEKIVANNARFNRPLTKRIEYAYFSSPSATEFGFGKTGCWIVQMQDGITIPQAIAGYAQYEDAKKHAEQLPQPWDRLTK